MCLSVQPLVFSGSVLVNGVTLLSLADLVLLVARI